MRLSEDDLRHSAEIDNLASAIENVLGRHDAVVISAVLATLLARFLCACPRPSMRPELLKDHLDLMNALIELHDLRTLDRQTN